MQSHLRANLWLLVFTLVICSVLYPAVLLAIGQIAFPDLAQGSLVTDAKGKVIGSRLIAQPFTGDEFFQPRPSAVAYKADASGASNWGANNYLLRDRVARQLGPIVRYGKGAESAGKTPGSLVGPDIDKWFQVVRYEDSQGKMEKGIVAKWAALHSGLAEAWIKNTGDALKGQWKVGDKEGETIASFLAQWQEDYPDLYNGWQKSETYAAWKKKNPDQATPPPGDLVTPFFESFSRAYPGSWPYLDEVETKDKQKRKKITAVKEAGDSQTEIRSVFFDMWRNEHPDIPLEEVPADMVMASGSGLDPHITLANALYQLKYRVAASQAQKLIKARVGDLVDAREKGTPRPGDTELTKLAEQVTTELTGRMSKPVEDKVREVLEVVLQERKEAPLGGLVGVDMVNVLELNQAMTQRMEKLAREYP